MAESKIITATGTGTTDSVFIEPGKFNCVVYSGTWGAATVEISPDDTNWVTLKSPYSDTSWALTANDQVEIQGNVWVRLNVSSYTADIVAHLRSLAG